MRAASRYKERMEGRMGFSKQDIECIASSSMLNNDAPYLTGHQSASLTMLVSLEMKYSLRSAVKGPGYLSGLSILVSLPQRSLSMPVLVMEQPDALLHESDAKTLCGIEDS